MRRIRYQVACSLDGYIADSQGGYDWIVAEPTFDFDALRSQFDTLLMGRKTYETVLAAGEGFWGMRVLVFSRTLDPAAHPDVEVVSRDGARRLDALRREQGRDLWLFGGGELFRSLLADGLVDTVEPAIIPVLLGAGIPFLPGPALRQSLALQRHQVYPSGITLLEYAVVRS